MIRVLVVDDVPDVRLSLQFMLQATGFDVVDASDGHAALKRMATQRIDVVLADLVMPGMDGLTLIDALSRWPAPRPAVIAMSGDPHLGYRAGLQAAHAVGADASLAKPFTDVELRALIHRLTGGGPALVEDSREPYPSTGERQRRHHRRTPEENTATSIIQLVLNDLNRASEALEKDLQGGADLRVISALLATAETLAWGRGLDVRLRIQQIRTRLHEAGYAV